MVVVGRQTAAELPGPLRTDMAEGEVEEPHHSSADFVELKE